MFMAHEVYGGAPPRQPTATPEPDHAPGEPEPFARTTPAVKGPLGNPVLLLVGMLALAFVLVSVSVRGGLSIEVAA